MNITLNNREESFSQSRMTISELLKEKNFTFRLLVVKINGQLIRKENYVSASIADGDKVDVIHLISGG